MKLPNSRRNAMREIDRVVIKVLKTIDSADARDKETFERVFDGVMLQVAKNRRVDVNQVATATSQVIEDIMSYALYKQKSLCINGNQGSQLLTTDHFQAEVGFFGS